MSEERRLAEAYLLGVYQGSRYQVRTGLELRCWDHPLVWKVSEVFRFLRVLARRGQDSLGRFWVKPHKTKKSSNLEHWIWLTNHDPNIKDWSLEFLRSFLAGFFDADGVITRIPQRRGWGQVVLSVKGDKPMMAALMERLRVAGVEVDGPRNPYTDLAFYHLEPRSLIKARFGFGLPSKQRLLDQRR